MGGGGKKPNRLCGELIWSDAQLLGKHSSVFLLLPPSQKLKKQIPLDQGRLVLTLEAIFGNLIPPTLTVHLSAQLEAQQLFLPTHLVANKKLES